MYIHIYINEIYINMIIYIDIYIEREKTEEKQLKYIILYIYIYIYINEYMYMYIYIYIFDFITWGGPESQGRPNYLLTFLSTTFMGHLFSHH